MKPHAVLMALLLVINLLTFGQYPVTLEQRYPRWNSNGAHYIVRAPRHRY